MLGVFGIKLIFAAQIIGHRNQLVGTVVFLERFQIKKHVGQDRLGQGGFHDVNLFIGGQLKDRVQRHGIPHHQIGSLHRNLIRAGNAVDVALGQFLQKLFRLRLLEQK